MLTKEFTMDRTKVLDKIKKCLALGKSPNEHEASAALRQAQKLMAAHDISERELGAIGYASESVKTSIQCTNVVPVTLSAIAHLVNRAFGTIGTINRTLREKDLCFEVEYFGPEHRVKMAAYAHVVIQRAVDGAWKQFLVENPHKRGKHGARAGFYAGWTDGVSETVEALGITDEERAGINAAKLAKYGRELSKAKMSEQRVDGSAMHAGSRAAEGFTLHRPISGERRMIGN
jgi:hypothetical protein